MKYRINLNLSTGINRPYFEEYHFMTFEAKTDLEAYDRVLDLQIKVDKKLQKDNVLNDYDILMTDCMEKFINDNWIRV